MKRAVMIALALAGIAAAMWRAGYEAGTWQR